MFQEGNLDLWASAILMEIQKGKFFCVLGES